MAINGRNLSYNAELKDEFKRKSTAFLRALAKSLPLIESKVSFNPGGIAVSGDAHLTGMFDNGTGIYITINDSVFGDRKMNFLYRTIKHMKDYTGGSNNYMSDSDCEDFDVVVNRIKNLCL